MASCVRFSDIKVGETYFVQNKYWHKLLGAATITEVFHSDADPDRGKVACFLRRCHTVCDWEHDLPDGDVYLNSDFDWFWDAEPTESQQRALFVKIFGW